MSEKSTRKSRLLHPSGDGWLLADVHADGQVDGATAAEASFSSVTASGERLVVALPARLFAATLVTVTASDLETRDAALQLQLEKLGLLQQKAGAAAAPGAQDEVGAQGDQRTMLAVLLDEQPEDGACIESAERFELAPRLVVTQERTLTIYRELGGLVAIIPAATGGIGYFQVLSGAEITNETTCELALLLQTVADLPGLPMPEKIILHSATLPDALQVLADATGLIVTTAGEPKRCLPATPWNLVPPRVLALRAASGRRRALKLVSVAALVVLLLVAGGMAAYFLRLSSRAASLREAIARVENDVSFAESSASSWQQMQLALDPDLYPIERLYQATRLLPPEGVRLTVFEQRGASIIISGEASSTPAAIKFANDLKRSPEWGGYTFEIPQPKILPNNSAQFRVTARAPGVASEPASDLP